MDGGDAGFPAGGHSGAGGAGGSTAPAVDAAGNADLSAGSAGRDGGQGTADAATATAGGTLTAVIVGYGAKRVSTTDGVSWAHLVQVDPNGGDDTNLFRGIAFGDGVFVAVGGFTSTSPDGVNWTDRGPVDSFISNVVWLDGRFVAAGGNGTRVRSLNRGVSWVDNQGFQPLHYRDIAAGNGVAVAVGHTYDASLTGIVVVTRDGAQWTETMRAGMTLNQVEFGNGIFVAVGDTGRCARSTDGITWNDCTISGLRGNLVFTDTEFILSTSTGVYRSTDGAAWATTASGRSVAAWFNGKYISFDWPAKLFASSDLAQWTNVFSPGGSGWSRLAQGRIAP